MGAWLLEVAREGALDLRWRHGRRRRPVALSARVTTRPCGHAARGVGVGTGCCFCCLCCDRCPNGRPPPSLFPPRVARGARRFRIRARLRIYRTLIFRAGLVLGGRAEGAASQKGRHAWLQMRRCEATSVKRQLAVEACVSIEGQTTRKRLIKKMQGSRKGRKEHGEEPCCCGGRCSPPPRSCVRARHMLHVAAIPYACHPLEMEIRPTYLAQTKTLDRETLHLAVAKGCLAQLWGARRF
eukprot:363965-Chlamydomonas_euryale.AAC.15